MGERADRDSLAAAATLWRSPRVRVAVLWIGGILWSALAAGAGWVGGRIEQKLHIEQLDKGFAAVNASLIDLASAQEKTGAAVKALDAQPIGDQPAGPLVLIRQELRFQRRDYVGVMAAVYAGESASRRSTKTAAAKAFVKSYDNLIEQGNTPSAAAQSVLRTIAIP